ncbi:heme ABC exporter ATP-binding protein CcmA [Mangrovicoccus algicola]|uniref:Heme ABC exporter ATP-binding protein CcmA n=1 Tax=Mangrovicoccus algicola TaxID=2771008 RepID=A0A8J6Z6C5_9RHOB|nr:heme ABC exporter ATP-binding protein CcmA [Mangrovicoccus algicola]MBE3638634.1 heme ABC exporter ATP-binding protein CcmA [Mangrovicoccus algicola]
MLRVTDLTCARGGVPVIQGVSFALDAGEALVLRGPNGIGKTTLLRVLAGLAPPLAGWVEGMEATAYAGHADGIKAQLSVAENLQFWAAVFGRRDIGPALGAFALDPLRDRPAGLLSAGQKRRLGLARLLVSGRPVWALDEPTVSLDAEGTALFAAAIAAHLGGGGAAVIATHIDLGLAGTRRLDLAGYRARPDARVSDFDEAFL